ncbi:MAG: UDP-sugar diphosphatase / 5-nucleotidase, partial [Symbiobacteriaceae bacterium]|nr:UDP-sugar diphosphatase / 5-nucleotidase [Symbiobacteriaceae bacterium]
MVLQIIHINDTDSTDPDAWAPAADLIRSLRRDGPCDLLLHAGDITLGAASGDELVSRLITLGVDAFALGNHDFDGGAGALSAQVRPVADRALCANVSGFAPFRLMEVRDLLVALIGVVHADLPLLQPARNLTGLTVEPPGEVLARLVPQLRAQADLVIVVSHCGLEADRQFATEIPGIDLIVGGHSHHLLTEPVWVNQTAIVQAGAYGRYVGVVTMEAGGTCNTGGTGGTCNTGGWRIQGRVMAAPAGAGATTGPGPGAAPQPDYARETPPGNLTTDLMRAFAGTDLSLLRCSSVNLADPPPADPAALNFCAGDEVVALDLTGRDLLALLECGVRDAYYLLTLSGGTVRYDGRRPEGQRVTRLTVAGAEVEPDRRYSIACSEILARGAAGFALMQGRPYRPLGATIGDLLRRHAAAIIGNQPTLDGRLAIAGVLPWE